MRKTPRPQVRLPRERWRLMSRFGPLPVLLLTVRGRKSGVARDVLLNYMRDGDRFVVFTSHAGEDRDPPWWLNLRDAGEAEILAGGERIRVHAREAQGADRDLLWSEAKRRDDTFIEYETRTARRIAVVVLERAYSIVAACTDVTYGRYCAARSQLFPSSRLAHTSPFAVPK